MLFSLPNKIKQKYTCRNIGHTTRCILIFFSLSIIQLYFSLNRQVTIQKVLLFVKLTNRINWCSRSSRKKNSSIHQVLHHHKPSGDGLNCFIQKQCTVSVWGLVQQLKKAQLSWKTFGKKCLCEKQYLHKNF